MITDDERRDVARRLRETRESVYEFRKELSEEGAYIHCDEQADYYLICKSVTGYIPREYMNLGDYAEIHERIANLIEPDPERTCHMTKIGGDRILAGWWECSECGPVYPPCKDEIAEWALRECPHCGAKVVDE